MIRVIDEEGEDYLYPRDWFLPIELPHNIEEALGNPTQSRDLFDGVMSSTPELNGHFGGLGPEYVRSPRSVLLMIHPAKATVAPECSFLIPDRTGEGNGRRLPSRACRPKRETRALEVR
jgi:hypothetical protein